MLAAESYSERLNRLDQSAKSRSTFIRVSAIALLLTYLATLELTFSEIAADWTNFLQHEVVKQKIEVATQQKRNAIRGGVIGKTAQKRLSAAQTQQKEAANAREKLKERLLEKTDLSLLGFSVKLPFRLIAAAWLFGSAVFILYVALSRQRTYSDIEEALSRSDETNKPRLYGVPVWMIPFPWQGTRGGVRSVQLLRESGASSLRQASLLLAVVILWFAVSLRVAFLGIQAAHIYEEVAALRDSTAQGTSTDFARLIVSGSPAFAAAVVTFAFLALLFWPIEGSPAANSSKAPKTVLGRRRLVLCSLGGLGSVFAVPVLAAQYRKGLVASELQLKDMFRKSSVRYRARKKIARPATGREAGFYVNPKSGVVHFVTPRQEILDINADMATTRLAPVTVPMVSPQGKRLRARRLPFAIEQAALGQFPTSRSGAVTGNADECDRACEILLAGLKRLEEVAGTRPCFRLFELSAGLAVRYQRLGQLNNVIEAAAASRFRRLLWRRVEVWKATIPLLEQTQQSGQNGEQSKSQIAGWVRLWMDTAHPVRWASFDERKPVVRNRSEFIQRVRWIYFYSG